MITPGALPPADSVLRGRQPYPGFALHHGNVFGRRTEDLTVDDHQALGDAKWVGFDELDAIAASYAGDPTVKRGNLTVLGPAPYPLAYVVGPDLIVVARGVHDATHGGYLQPGASPRHLTGYEREADRLADLEALQRSRRDDAELDWVERRLLRGAS